MRIESSITPAIAAVSALIVALTTLPAIAGEEAWTGDISASLTAQTGTTDSVAGSVDAKTERSWEKDFLGFRFNALYGTTRTRNKANNDRLTQNSQGLFGDWKRTLHERFFWDTGAEVSRDTIQRREVRAAVNTGPGYRFWEGEAKDKEHLDLSAGVGYRYENYDANSNGSGDHDEDHFADIVASFDYKNLLFDDRIEYTHTAQAKMPANAPDQFIVSTEVVVGVPITEAWSFRVGFFAEYINDQPDEVNNTTTRTTVGLGYKF